MGGPRRHILPSEILRKGDLAVTKRRKTGGAARVFFVVISVLLLASMILGFVTLLLPSTF